MAACTWTHVIVQIRRSDCHRCQWRGLAKAVWIKAVASSKLLEQFHMIANPELSIHRIKAYFISLLKRHTLLRFFWWPKICVQECLTIWFFASDAILMKSLREVVEDTPTLRELYQSIICKWAQHSCSYCDHATRIVSLFQYFWALTNVPR